jgi:hypothetical protein
VKGYLVGRGKRALALILQWQRVCFVPRSRRKAMTDGREPSDDPAAYEQHRSEWLVVAIVAGVLAAVG